MAHDGVFFLLLGDILYVMGSCDFLPKLTLESRTYVQSKILTQKLKSIPWASGALYSEVKFKVQLVEKLPTSFYSLRLPTGSKDHFSGSLALSTSYKRVNPPSSHMLKRDIPRCREVHL